MKKNNSANRLNGSVARLASALKDVFTEAVEPLNVKIDQLQKETRGGFIQVNQVLQDHGRRLEKLEKKL